MDQVFFPLFLFLFIFVAIRNQDKVGSRKFTIIADLYPHLRVHFAQSFRDFPPLLSFPKKKKNWKLEGTRSYLNYKSIYFGELRIAGK